MTTSQNGWSASAVPSEIGIAPCAIDGVVIGDGLRAGDVTVVLSYVLRQVHTRVESLVAGWCWGYKYRVISGASTLSNHASGTAVDVNAPKHPRGERDTFTAAQVVIIHEVLSSLDGVVRWGGDYVAPAVVDEMHFEINASATRVAALAERLRSPMQVLDYSAGYPRPSVVKSAGYGGAVRYLRKEGTSVVKPITVAEYAGYVASALDVALVYQHVTQTRPTQGRAAGQHDAHWAVDRATELNVHEPVIYFAVDFDAEPSTVDAYFQGVIDVVGVARTGVYGSYRVVEYLVDHGRATYAWQTVAWSHGLRSTRAHLFQRLGQVTIDGVSCDVNDVLKTNFGAVNQPREDDDMFTDEDRRMLFNLDAVNGAIALKRDTVTLMVNDGTAITATEFPVAQWLPGAVDEVALAAELAKRGIGGVSAQELVSIMNSVKITASQTGL